MDVLVTVLLGLGLLAAAAAALLFSPFLVMATDSADKPRTGMLLSAFAVTWGGAALAVLGAGFGIWRAAVRDQPMWVWPAAGLAVLGLSFALGALLATRSART